MSNIGTLIGKQWQDLKCIFGYHYWVLYEPDVGEMPYYYCGFCPAKLQRIEGEDDALAVKVKENNNENV